MLKHNTHCSKCHEDMQIDDDTAHSHGEEPVCNKCETSCRCGKFKRIEDCIACMNN